MVARTLILVTLFLSVYNWSYYNIFHETFYEKYLPNYEEEVEFPVYSITDGEQVNDTSISDDMTTYLPLFPFFMYKIAMALILLIPVLFVISLILSISYYVRHRKSGKTNKWALLQTLLIVVTYLLNMYTK